VTRSIRPVRLEDAAAIAAIYAPYVTDTVITFELDPPDEAEFCARIERITATHPWLVAEIDGTVMGYAYGSAYRTRAAYRWVCETGIYVAGTACGQGIGRPLYQALLDELARRGFVAAMGVMTANNPGSTALHEKLGFVDRGTQPGIGYKHGAWHDVVFWQKDLGPRPADPGEPAGSS
jgi:L-amino acid N-acyltransferase YncA